jgi:hypothetical protein
MNYNCLGVLAYGILQMRGIGGLAGWQVSTGTKKGINRMRKNFNHDSTPTLCLSYQWLFLIEGIPTVLVSFVA